MSLLREIQEGATNHTVPLADLLRRCLILAQRLRHDPLARWAEQELNGYPNDDALPPYRGKRWAEVRGNFRNSAWNVTNRLIPSLAVEEKHRELLFTHAYLSGVAHYESLLASGEQNFGSPWSADYIALYQSRLMPGLYLTEARQGTSRAEIEAMLDQIRNRILSFALEIETQNPKAGEAEPKGDPPVAPEKVGQIFNTHIWGGTNIVASGSRNVIKDFQLAVNDWPALENALKDLGLPDAEINSLQKAIEQDIAGQATAPGPAVKTWLGDVTARIATGSIAMANSAAGSAIATLVMAHLGVV